MSVVKKYRVLWRGLMFIVSGLGFSAEMMFELVSEGDR